jgi:hypothetical protein
MRGNNSFYLFTSISPLLGADELEYQKSRIASWRSSDLEVATVDGCARRPDRSSRIGYSDHSHACLEEIAFRKRWLTNAHLENPNSTRLYRAILRDR